MPVGLVLGAGGVGGASFHAGALSVLDLDLGWDARDATVIVGTSAGAVTGGLLRSGYRASDIAALVAGVPNAAEHPSVRDGTLERQVIPAVSPWDFIRLPRRPPVRSWMTRPHRVRLRHLAAGLVGAGRRDRGLVRSPGIFAPVTVGGVRYVDGVDVRPSHGGSRRDPANGAAA